MRRLGASIRDIEKQLGIPRSTLSGWLRNIVLTKEHKDKLTQNWLAALVKARQQAVLSHNRRKKGRLKEAQKQAQKTLSKINTSSKAVLELALAMLYLGEGSKTKQTGMGNSDPLLLKFFIAALKNLYGYDVSSLRCELHIRADQNPDTVREYWSKELSIPIENFTGIYVDKRTLGRPTFPYYKGVCVVHCSGIAIQRKLVYLSQSFCEEIIKNKGFTRIRSSVG